ncbi:MAG: DUF2937 family protein [Alphaproteobacteria bacterium]|nr:DUF2937 family protein [Alphaproteobacteria bacterium]
MGWAWAKLVALVGTGVAAVCAAASAQGPALVQAYLQRLGGHIDEARRTLQGFVDGTTGRLVADEATRQRLIDEFSRRVSELEQARARIVDAHPLLQPVELARNADPDILSATVDAFTPAMPLDTTSLVYAGAGLAIGWAVWEVVQWPLRARARRHRIGGGYPGRRS